MSEDADGARQMLRHTVATLAYRGGKALRGAPPEFAELDVCPGTRTPLQILAHVGDVLDWACALCDGKRADPNAAPLPWDGEVARFFAGLERLDARLSDPAPLAFPPQKLFQGHIADALTHVGQLALLRRIAGSSVRAENYFVADIVAGRVGPEQAPPRMEFD